jgi:hypothetical protein
MKTAISVNKGCHYYYYYMYQITSCQIQSPVNRMLISKESSSRQPFRSLKVRAEARRKSWKLALPRP